MQVEYQEVEEGPMSSAHKGSGGGATLMFCAHMDHFDNPQETVVEDDQIYGRGLVNMKAAFPCYIKLAALQKAGVQLKGDLIISGVVGEIEKARSADFRKKIIAAPESARVMMDHGVMADHVHHRRAYRTATANRQRRAGMGARQRRWQGYEIRIGSLQGGAGDSGLGEEYQRKNPHSLYAADRANRRHRWW